MHGHATPFLERRIVNSPTGLNYPSGKDRGLVGKSSKENNQYSVRVDRIAGRRPPGVNTQFPSIEYRVVVCGTPGNHVNVSLGIDLGEVRQTAAGDKKSAMGVDGGAGRRAAAADSHFTVRINLDVVRYAGGDSHVAPVRVTLVAGKKGAVHRATGKDLYRTTFACGVACQAAGGDYKIDLCIGNGVDRRSAG